VCSLPHRRRRLPSPDYPLLVIGAPLVVEVEAGIDDKAWLGQEEPAEITDEQATSEEEAA
jgi:hypothetical protein